MTTTNRHSLQLLARSILNKLENNQIIVFNPKDRLILQDELLKRLSQSVLTEEDLNQKIREQVTAVSETLTEQNFTETEAYQSQKRLLKTRLSENQVAGFYLLSSLREICEDTCKFLFETRFVEDVFESDEDIQKLVMEIVQKFDESKLA